MECKLIIFDLDGVLVSTKHIHYSTLNRALREVGEKYVISESEHLSTYDGLKTSQKLELLTKYKGLDAEWYEQIWYRKQQLTLDEIYKLKKDEQLIQLFEELTAQGYKLACCSNSIRQSVEAILSNIGLSKYMNLILSNEHVKNPKPHPEIYWVAMSMMGVLPEETLIVEDSPHGLLAANRSGANVLRVDNPKDLTSGKIFNILNNTNYKIMKPKWKDDTLNVVIPMAGAGSKFRSELSIPKFLADVENKPMIQAVVENLNIDANFIYVVLKSDYDAFNLNSILNLITPNCKIVTLDYQTYGALETILKTTDLINNDNPLLISNSDQLLDWDSNQFMYKMNETDCDASIVTFTSTLPKYSYIELDEFNFVKRTAEKSVISNNATAGVYYFKRGSDFIENSKYHLQDERNKEMGEWYLVPVFNEFIKHKFKVIPYQIKNRICFGDFFSYKKYVENKNY